MYPFRVSAPEPDKHSGRYCGQAGRNSWALGGYTCSGLSRIEIVVIFAVVSLLAVNLLPAVNRAREAMRRSQCANNMRHLGIALQAYHDTHGMLPPCAFWASDGIQFNQDGRLERTVESMKVTHENWFQLLLPTLGKSELAHQFDPQRAVTDLANAAARTASASFAKCPSDTFNRPDNLYRLEFDDGTFCDFSRGNYGINGGSHTGAEYPGYLAFPVPNGNVIQFDEISGQFQWWGSGVAGFNKCFSFGDFENGLSTLVAVDELRAGIIPEDPRGVWAFGQIGGSVTWAHGVNGDAFGPNCQIPNSDDILGGKVLYQRLGHQMFLEEQMPFCDHCSLSNQSTARSMHPGGVNTLMMDGSVHFVSDSINPSLWHVMHSRGTPTSAIDEGFLDDLEDGDSYEEALPSLSGMNDNPDSPEIIENSLGMSFTRVPAGEFTMGLPDRGNRWPYPQETIPHKVLITRPFYLGTFEVTQSQFAAVMDANPSWHAADGEGKEDVRGIVTSAFPVENVSWDEANEFCASLSRIMEEKKAGRVYRLPTEAEWEYACRAGVSEPVQFEPDWDETAAQTGEIGGKLPPPSKTYSVPKPIGSHPANRFGISDMRGNVFEWCHDWFSRDYYSHSPINDPQGPASGFLKVIRGWDWVFIGNQCKDYHMVAAPWRRSRYVGFRVVCAHESPIVADRAKTGPGYEPTAAISMDPLNKK